MRQHHRQLTQRPAALRVPLVEGGLHQGQVLLASWRLVDDLLGLERGNHVIGRDEGVLADHAQKPWRRQAAELVAVLGQVLPQADDIGHRPVGDQRAEAAFFLAHIEDELGIARHALELAQMANQPRILHQPFQMLGAHQHHLLRIEAEEHLLEGRPLGVDQAVLEAGAEHPQRQQRQVAIITQRTQLGVGAGLWQARLQRRGRAEAVEAVFVEPLIVTHA